MLSPYRTGENEKNVIIVGLIISCVSIGIILFLVGFPIVSHVLGNNEVIGIKDLSEVYKSIKEAIITLSLLCFGCLLIPSVFPFVRKLSFKDLNIEMKPEGRFSTTTSILQEIDFYLCGDKKLSKKEIEKLIRLLDYTHIDLVFQFLNNWRTQKVFQIIHLSQNDEKEISKYRQEIGMLIPLFETLLSAANCCNYQIHPYYAALAFVYKDKDETDWLNSYLNIERAIQRVVQEEGTDAHIGLYHFNRLVCGINILTEKKFNQKKLNVSQSDFFSHLQEDYEIVTNDITVRYMLNSTSDSIAPNLKKWLEENKKKRNT
jgi:hypothetical protein